MSGLILHGYWRSSASYRVRLALALKGLDHAQVTHDLRHGEQGAAGYVALAPHGLVPALEHDGGVLIESPAILEWLEARWPSPPLLPVDPDAAAMVRAMAALVACDIHPLNNLRVLTALRRDLGATEDQVSAWIADWTGRGFAALEVLVARHGGRFAFADEPTLADCTILPQVYNARRFGVPLEGYPRLVAAADALGALPEVAGAHPEAQPDAAG